MGKASYNDLIAIETPENGIGTLAEVEIDTENSTIKRTFKVNGTTVSGQTHNFTEEQVNLLFNNEVYWLNTLSSDWLPELIEINTDEQYIIQRYYGDNLLTLYENGTLRTAIPNIVEQVIDLYGFFKTKNVFKYNGALSNMTHNNGKLIAFDFKWAAERPNGLEYEHRSYDEWLSKINSSLPDSLKYLINT